MKEPLPTAPSPHAERGSPGASPSARPRRISVATPDGVEILGAASGEGPGLALVYGAMMEQTGWARLLPYLQPGRALYTYDRRGRGESGDAPEYTVDREVDDLLTFATALPQPLDVFAHSSGALLTLYAAMRGLQVRHLVLYEPLLPSVRESQASPDLPNQLRALIRAGNRDGAMELFLREGVELPDEDLARVRGSERWQAQLTYVETAAYDSDIALSFILDSERLSHITAPTLLLVGSESPAWMQEGVRRFADAIPGSRVEVIEGQGHNAQFSAPEALAKKIRGFLDQ